MRLPVITARTCGECAVCCIDVRIEPLDKPAREPCRNLGPGHVSCTVHGTNAQPKVCKAFLCAWIQGAGGEDDRPDKIGVMVTVQQIENGTFALALEHKPGAVLATGQPMITAVATSTKLPVIVSDYESLPPHDKGDRVAVHSSIMYRARRLLGEMLTWIGPDVALFRLVKGG